MPVRERRRRHEGLKSIVTARDPGGTSWGSTVCNIYSAMRNEAV